MYERDTSLDDVHVLTLVAYLEEYAPKFTMARQDPEVGFPPEAPPGYWVQVPTPTGHTSYCAPKIEHALQAAVLSLIAQGFPMP